MLQGAMQSANWIAVGVIVVSTVLTAGYFLPIIVRAFFRPPPALAHGMAGQHDHASGEAPLPILLALVATAVGSVALFFFPGVPLALSQMMIGP
jgi:multicomponent Na+:H+ antiporter subunit D